MIHCGAAQPSSGRTRRGFPALRGEGGQRCATVFVAPPRLVPSWKSRSNPPMWSSHPAAVYVAPLHSAVGGGVRVGGSIVVTARKEP